MVYVLFFFFTQNKNFIMVRRKKMFNQMRSRYLKQLYFV